MTFFPDNEWKNKKMMQQITVDSTENFRLNLGYAINLTADYATEGHSPNSWHYKGLAVDGNTQAPLWLFISLAMKYFTGIGIYVKDNKILYFHLDNRNDGTHQMWIGFVQNNGNIVYTYKLGA